MLNVNVTAKDIENGIYANGYACPIALALKRKIDTLVRVDSKSVLVKTHDAWESIPLPELARWFIARFDHGHPVKPFKFRLDIIGGKNVRP